MRITFEHLGPIRSATLDLSKELIVLSGPNNEGKTYLASTVYGVARPSWEFPQEYVAELSAWIQERFLAGPALELSLAEFVQTWGSRVATLVAESRRQTLHEMFATRAERFESLRLAIELDSNAIARAIQTLSRAPSSGSGWISPLVLSQGTVDVVSDGQRYRLHLRSKGELEAQSSSPVQMTTAEFELLSAEERQSALIALARIFSMHCWQGFIPRAVIFPAERIATNLFSKELSLRRTALVDGILAKAERSYQSDYLTEMRGSARRYPLPIRDSLRIAEDLAELSKRDSELADLAEELESRVLGGRIGLSQYGDLRFIAQGESAPELELQESATIVKSLAMLVFYFRHLARPGHLLIIDEPELNLHPNNQRLIARVLVQAVNRGIRVLMSTHSDYVIRELNNLIMLHKPGSKHAEELCRELGYKQEELLDPAKAAVYMVDAGTATPMEISAAGFQIATIEDEIHALNQVSQRIYTELLDSE